MHLLETLDVSLTEGSDFANTAALTARTAAMFSLISEVAAENGALSDSDDSPRPPSHEDTVLRRYLELYFDRLRGGDNEATDLLTQSLAADIVYPPDPLSTRPDARFGQIHVSPGRTLRVLELVDVEDPWTARFLDLFRIGLTEPDSRYGVVPAKPDETEVIRRAAALLEQAVPGIARSVHSHLAYVGVVEGEGAFESASDRRVPRAVFINRAALTDVPRTAEALLHECVHQKLYDIQLVHALYRTGYDERSATVIRPPWHDDAAWSFDRALAASHVYVHLAALYTVLAEASEPLIPPEQATVGRDRTVERARFLLEAVAGASDDTGPSGKRFIEWLTARFRELAAAV